MSEFRVSPLTLEYDGADIRVSHDFTAAVRLWSPDQARALFRYLAGLVLPKVEMFVLDESVSETGYRVDGREYCTAYLWEGEPVVHLVIPRTGRLTPTQARALVACLLAAIDAAEGVER